MNCQDNNKRKNGPLIDEIILAQKMGITVCINGTEYPVGKTEELSVMLETGEYMSDYIGDEDGRIIKICYDEIK